MLNIYLFRFLQIVCWGSSDFITNDDLVTVNPEQVNRALQCQTTEAWWSHYLLNPLGLLRRWFTSVFSSLSLVVTGTVSVWHHLQRIKIQPRAHVTALHRLGFEALNEWACLHDIIVLHVNCLILVHSVGVLNLGKLIFSHFRKLHTLALTSSFFSSSASLGWSLSLSPVMMKSDPSSGFSVICHR